MYLYSIWDPNTSQYQIWDILHVEDISFGINKPSQPYGIPTKSSSATQVFENQGPIATFQIKFVRFDYEEDVPNWDFMYTKDYKKNGKRYKGIDWYTAQLQTTRPYRFAIRWVDDNIDSSDPGTIPTGDWKVSVTAIKYSIDSTNPGMAEFNISLTERR